MGQIDFEEMILDFPIYGKTGARSIKKELVRVATGGLIKRNTNNILEVRALNRLNFTIKHGARIGLIGHNGAGKSSLLRIIAGIYIATYGSIKIEGVVTSLLDVGLAMYEDLSGIENILLKGTLQGLSKIEIAEKKDLIIKNSGLGDYIHMPMRTYSQGMKVRLAFAISTCIDPEILIMDELVGAGDESFQKEAKEVLRRLVISSDIFIIASHNLNWIQDNCNQILWLDTGKVVFYGDVEEGLDRYKSCMNKKSKSFF